MVEIYEARDQSSHGALTSYSGALRCPEEEAGLTNEVETVGLV